MCIRDSLYYADGAKSYIIAPNGLTVGQQVMSGENATPEDVYKRQLKTRAPKKHSSKYIIERAAAKRKK